jgi:hypothetical protein
MTNITLTQSQQQKQDGRVIGMFLLHELFHSLSHLVGKGMVKGPLLHVKVTWNDLDYAGG